MALSPFAFLHNPLVNGLIEPICDTIALEGDAVAFQKYVVDPWNNLCEAVSHFSREKLAGIATGLLLTPILWEQVKKLLKKVKETVEKTVKDYVGDGVKKESQGTSTWQVQRDY